MRDYHFPDNCWCGVTVTAPDLDYRIAYLHDVCAKCKFISFEPLHGDCRYSDLDFYKIDWIIIGAETGNRKGKIIPRQEWIAHLLVEAEDLNIPVFMKDNLKQYWHGNLRQEFPKEK